MNGENKCVVRGTNGYNMHIFFFSTPAFFPHADGD